MYVGLPVNTDNREVSLRSLSKRSLKRSDKKSGRKKPRTNDIDAVVHPAPDSLQEKENDIKTPKSKKKLKFSSPVSVKAEKGEEIPKKSQKITICKSHLRSSFTRPEQRTMG